MRRLIILSFRKAVKANVPKVDLQAYNVLVAGGFKSGKTRLWKEVMELHYPNEPDAGLLLAFEDGYNSWELDSVIDMHNRDWDFFRKEVVPGLVHEAKEGRVSKVIGIDTVDRMISSAEEWIIKTWNKKYAKRFTSIQEFNENIKDENVYVELKKEIWRQIDTLKKAGYGCVWLAWTKEKETSTIDGLKFNSITLSMSKTGKDIFESQAHLICCLHNDVKVYDKEGNELDENAKTKKGKELASNFHATEVNMYFRPSNYIDIAGGRFTELPDKVPYSAENFMKVFEDAVEGQLKKTKKSVDELKAEQGEQREEAAKDYAEQEETADKAGELVESINDKIAELKKVKKTPLIADKFTELFGAPLGYKESTDVTKLEEALTHANSVK